MRRVLVVFATIAVALGAHISSGTPASAGCRGAQRNAFPCDPYVPCFDEDGDGVIECTGAGDISVDLSVQP
ncbi:MAG TPA: hypothetical protein VFA34_02035 [Actinomycetota bacterium]|jgi:hypothetical protein|nr:hypothetical protein [Actinomycetota bacterium]